MINENMWLDWTTTEHAKYISEYEGARTVSQTKTAINFQGVGLMVSGFEFEDSIGNKIHPGYAAVSQHQKNEFQAPNKELYLRIRSDELKRCAPSVLAKCEMIRSEKIGFINLKKELSEIKRNMRKSYKSLIAKQDEVTISSKHQLDKDFEQFEELHLKLSGRATRSHATWEAMKDACRVEEGLLVRKTCNEETLGFSYFMLNKVNAYYGSSAIIDRKGAHPMIWRAIVECKKRDIANVIMDIEEIGKEYTEKEKNIRKFKFGFGLDVAEFTVIRVGASGV